MTKFGLLIATACVAMFALAGPQALAQGKNNQVASTTKAEESHRLVLQVNTNDPAMMNWHSITPLM